MYYALVFYPNLGKDLAESIEEIRRNHDPTVGFVKPHITIVFPVPDIVGESRLASHIESVLNDWSPFEVGLSRSHRSHDHWLFLTLGEGDAEIRRLYRSLYTEILAEYRRDDIEFVPHIGLGLFIKEGSKYDWDNPQEAEFDEQRYQEAWQQANALPLGSGYTVDKLHLVSISDEVIEWATGGRAGIPEGTQVVDVREFRLG